AAPRAESRRGIAGPRTPARRPRSPDPFHVDRVLRFAAGRAACRRHSSRALSAVPVGEARRILRPPAENADEDRGEVSDYRRPHPEAAGPWSGRCRVAARGSGSQGFTDRRRTLATGGRGSGTTRVPAILVGHHGRAEGRYGDAYQ